MTFNYTRDIPDGPHNPSSDQPPMKVNTNAIDDILAVDHVSFNAANGGIHKQVNMANEASPTRLADLVLYSRSLGVGRPNVLWAKNSTADLPLFNNAVFGANGYTSTYGNITFQWGRVNQAFSSGSTTGTTNFPVAFSNMVVVVTANPLVTFGSLPSSAASVNIRATSLGNTVSFDWQFYTNSGDYIGFDWFAIGQ